MLLEAVTVCFNYSDFLAETIPYNIGHFDRWVIVTGKDDLDTQKVCRRFSLPYLVTDEVYRDGDEFNKGRAVIKGLDHLSSEGWVLHLDADMALPAHTRKAIDMAHCQNDTIYGVDRVMVKTWDQWQKLQRTGWLRGQFGKNCYVDFPQGFQVGTRWVSAEHGYCPIGDFQLWWGRSDLVHGHHSKVYPHRHNDAARSDIQHSLYWDRRQRQLMPEIIAAHLESEPSTLGVNWKGRKSKPFGPVEEESYEIGTTGGPSCGPPGQGQDGLGRRGGPVGPVPGGQINRQGPVRRAGPVV